MYINSVIKGTRNRKNCSSKIPRNKEIKVNALKEINAIRLIFFMPENEGINRA